MKTFEQVSSATFECLKSKLKSQGISLEGNSGYLSKNGISLDFNYSEADQALTIANLEVGFPASMIGMNKDKILAILGKAIDECKG
ncbi:MAG: hypothetical protein ACJAS3_002213 [Roseivirga sp.]|jgi:hypothetical protein